MTKHLTAGPEELRQRFFALQNRNDIIQLLEIEEKQLIYHLYISTVQQRYLTFQIPKRAGGARDICAPATGLKIIQQKLNQVLQAVYARKASVHGFTHERSIVTNARAHTTRKFVLNVDLKDFFPSINFGRVRGLFMAIPYGLNSEVATILAQICCHGNQLPQGAPTSPIVSNMICAKMDSQLRQLAEAHECIYTRYADDLTFSTYVRQFPTALATASEVTGQVELGDVLISTIQGNGFDVNSSKIRLQARDQRQEVTGLTVNKFPNVQRKFVREIRAMLHAWRKFGLDAAESEFHRSYCNGYASPFKKARSFKQVVRGKIEFLGMVRGKTNPMYVRFREELWKLAPELGKPPELGPEPGKTTSCAIIITEGKTDWKHLKHALTMLQEAGQFIGLEIDFQEYEDQVQMGDAELLAHCKHLSVASQSKMTICVFDNDNPKITREVTGEHGGYRNWGNNVFSFAIPVPEHRRTVDNAEVSIELYYKDSDLKRQNPEGRRLFLSNEFNRDSGKHLELDGLNCTDLNKIRRGLCVIDNKVYDRENKNIALPKADFAALVLSGAPTFDDLDASAFRDIFGIVEEIILQNLR